MEREASRDFKRVKKKMQEMMEQRDCDHIESADDANLQTFRPGSGQHNIQSGTNHTHIFKIKAGCFKINAF